MLVLTRKEGQELRIGDDIVVVVNRISGNRVTIGIEAPREVAIVRSELQPSPPAAAGGKPASRQTPVVVGMPHQPLGTASAANPW